MIIKTLVEDTSISEDYKFEHGLCFYIETNKHKILFDLGKSDLFLENAKKLDIDVSEIDTVIISHGHYDHGGGLEEFLKVNQTAKIYVHNRAFEKYYSVRAEGNIAYIGLDEKLKNNKQIIFTNDYIKIDEELELFSNIRGKELPSLSNKALLMQEGDTLTQDTFAHEQSLIITQEDKTALIAGCAHNGIVNIIQDAMTIKLKEIYYIIGGFHLYNPSKNTTELPELIQKIATRLVQTRSKYYTCHCTGIVAYEILKDTMNDDIEYLATGSVVYI